ALLRARPPAPGERGPPGEQDGVLLGGPAGDVGPLLRGQPLDVGERRRRGTVAGGAQLERRRERRGGRRGPAVDHVVLGEEVDQSHGGLYAPAVTALATSAGR